MAADNENAQMPNTPPPPQPSIQELIYEKLQQLRGISEVYTRVPRLSSMSNTMNEIIKNIETLSSQNNSFHSW